MTDEMGLQTFPKTDTYDVDVTYLWLSFPKSGSSNR